MSGQRQGGLLNRRRFAGSLKINAPEACVGADSQALQTKYLVSDEILGQGTTAVVKRGTCKKNGHAVAIKEIKTYGDEELGEIMRKEFELMRALQHPNIVGVYDFFLAPQLTKAYLCLQLVDGKSLERCVMTEGKLTEEAMRPLFEQLVSALVYLHCKRIIHRDLKPDNVLVCSTMDKCLICDFNCARNLADGCTLTNRVGTMLFAPPEMMLGRGLLGEQTDIWNAGMCLYYALSGGCTVATGKSFASNASFGEYLANATSAERQKWIASIGLSKETAVAQVLWACLNPDPAQRPDAMLLLAHPWLTDDRQEDIPSILRSTSSPMNTPKVFNSKSTPMNVGGYNQPKTDAKSRAARSERLCANGLGIPAAESAGFPAMPLGTCPSSGKQKRVSWSLFGVTLQMSQLQDESGESTNVSSHSQDPKLAGA